MSHARPLGSVFHDALRESDEAAKRKGLAGLSTGFIELDFCTSGMLPGQLWTIGGSTGSGKSALVLTVALAVVETGGHVLLGSLEMTAVALAHRVAAMKTGLDLLKIISGRLSPEEHQRFVAALGQVKAVADRIHVDERPRLTLDDVREELKTQAFRGDLKLGIVDYMQLVTPLARQGTREREVAETARGLKQLAMEFEIPIIGCSQLSRAADAAEEPSLYHLRESGEIEHASDVVLLIGAADSGIAHLRLAKCRNGKRGRIDLSWTPECTRFANLSLRDDLLPGARR